MQHCVRCLLCFSAESVWPGGASLLKTDCDSPVDGVQYSSSKGCKHGSWHRGRSVGILQRNALHNAPCMNVGCAGCKEEARQDLLYCRALLDLGLHLHMASQPAQLILSSLWISTSHVQVCRLSCRQQACQQLLHLCRALSSGLAPAAHGMPQFQTVLAVEPIT